VLEEDYVWGSFLQSRMFAAGVSCGNCHDPHSLELRAPGNLLCRTCHDPVVFDTTTHHGHRPDTPGAACVDCHMPETVYMGVDARRDYSFIVPRPALGRETGAPDPCTGCHTDRPETWAEAALLKLGQRPALPPFALAFHAAASGRPDAEGRLLAVIADSTVPPVRRAGALRLLRSVAGARSIPTVERALAGPEAYVRWAALDFLGLLPAPARGPLAGPLLDDPVKSVRIEAARVLADPASRAALDPSRHAAFEAALDEYGAVLRMDADRPEAMTSLGLLRAAQGDTEGAEAAFREALALSPWYVTAIVNLADLYRAGGREGDGERVLREGLRRLPASADLHHALGLLLVRTGRDGEGLDRLGRAAELQPSERRFGYVYAVALNSSRRAVAAVATVEALLERFPDDPELLFLLATVERDRGRTDRALQAARRLAAVAPEDPRGPALIGQLER